eukprot:CAMPEP_0175945570 /NCGR_PEP_ID=MMETSP0108-20121206/26788_1 /TAXON_ID=195067 ORGANISM="Goniomonas pacifica, Strain CCMP1869" /NCGR_SAMPLE_ID=MMETSP0108 /ASSEMBLY_ACC=CAM_ASM_000204 /LENGTH=58 /DNA_ID=CAMNT_0017270873 /DNA_START=672 /DNA_END=848 /DNA_ORIENTATION=+
MLHCRITIQHAHDPVNMQARRSENSTALMGATCTGDSKPTSVFVEKSQTLGLRQMADA